MPGARRAPLPSVTRGVDSRERASLNSHSAVRSGWGGDRLVCRAAARVRPPRKKLA